MLVLLCWQHLKVLCEASEDQLMDSVPSSVSRTGPDSLHS